MNTFNAFCLCVCTQFCPPLCSLMDCSPSGCPWTFPGKNTGADAIPSSSGSSQPRDWTHTPCVSCIGRQIHYHFDNWEALNTFSSSLYIDLRFGVHIYFFLTNKILLNKWKVIHLRTKKSLSSGTEFCNLKTPFRLSSRDFSLEVIK